jgi:hypothetical protein
MTGPSGWISRESSDGTDPNYRLILGERHFERRVISAGRARKRNFRLILTA